MFAEPDGAAGGWVAEPDPGGEGVALNISGGVLSLASSAFSFIFEPFQPPNF